MAALSSSGETWSAEASATKGTAWAVRRARICSFDRRASAAVYRNRPAIAVRHTPLADQLVERIVDVDMELVGEVLSEPALRRLGHPRLERGHERPVAREPHRLMRPETVLVKARDRAEG